MKKHCIHVFMLFIVGIYFAYSQEKTVTGYVIDQDDIPLPGVSILIKGTTTGVQSDFDGNYSIQVSEGQVLVFSYIGQKTVERTVEGANTINIQMEQDAQALEEVVVTAFGKTKQKKSLGYATVSVSAKDLTEVNNTNPFESLSGKVAGVDITVPAQPGASAKVILRGFSSLGSNSPLYIVDGSPISNANNRGSDPNNLSTDATRTYDAGNGLNDIDPNNIANINVLKGAAAAAIYGSRASNGAIIITTKRALEGQKLRVDLSTATDFSEVGRLPHYQNSFGQGWAGQSYSRGTDASNENGSWGAPFDGEIRTWGNIVDNSQQIKPYVALEDNIKDFFQAGTSFTNSVRLSGGGETTNFSFIFTDTNSDGVIPTEADALDRKVFNLSAGLRGKRFRARTVANYITRDQNIVNTGQSDNAGEGESLIQEIIQIPRDISVLDLRDYENNPFNNNDNFYTPYSRNPWWTINENKTFYGTNRFFGNVNLAYDLLPNLVLTAQVGADISNNTLKSYGAIVSYTPGSPNALDGATNNAGGVTEGKNDRKEYDSFITLDYSTDFSTDLTFNATLGGAYNEISTNFLSVSITDLSVPDFYELTNTAGRQIATQADSKRRIYGIFGSAELGYKDRVFLTFTGRNDWSSTLPIGANSYFYPSVALSGVVIENDNTFAKVRASYAKVAKDTGPYATANTLIQAGVTFDFGQINFPIAGQNAFELSGILGNPNLKPEITREYEFGAEVNLFNRRLNIDAAYYNKDTEGVIINRPLARSTGYLSTTGNFIDLNNKGFELSLGIVPVQTDNFRWNVNYTFTKNENEVTDIAEGLSEILINSAFAVNFYAEKGRPLGVYKTRVAATTDDGRTIVDPSSGIPLQVDNEEEIGTSQRDFVMGLKNSFSYKNFTLAASLDWKEGGEMYSYTARLLGFTGNSLPTLYNDRSPFIVPNSVNENADGTYSENTTPINYIDVTGFYSSSNNGSIEETHVIDKTFVRLRDMSLTYNLPLAFVEKLGLTTAAFSVYGKNLALWTPDSNPYVDPEVSTFGDDLASEFGEFAGNPTQRTYGFALKVSF
ncbi:SusC/RagA family TonB-linked outer membrane protein [Pseudozobellia thermophila]|uniref:TonB-linked outer membrane protein, SusC/RagA family n=1 Tax=Pseudozobellia thermophila TaxID=192903 RepID=A0A1M6HPI2_9FLAO|nr:SusC/RagA family TonB-linked outer membrane protein [Pseudozobellia thermophila]SHJ24099.1 TonB-linked outer membrane protein, SusC/RagA family [Pseudozobellia thermophila]